MQQQVMSQQARRKLERRLEELEDEELPELEAAAERSDDPLAMARLEAALRDRSHFADAPAASIPLEELSHDPNVVEVGDRVTLLMGGGNELEAFTITPPIGTRLDEFWISSETPMAEALLGHRVGDTVEVRAPGGATRYSVLRIDRDG